MLLRRPERHFSRLPVETFLFHSRALLNWLGYHEDRMNGTI